MGSVPRIRIASRDDMVSVGGRMDSLRLDG
jgi:hypothetical protein